MCHLSVITKWVSMERFGRQKRGQPFLWGDVGDGEDFKEAFLGKLRTNRELSSNGRRPEGEQREGGCREVGKAVQAGSM